MAASCLILEHRNPLVATEVYLLALRIHFRVAEHSPPGADLPLHKNPGIVEGVGLQNGLSGFGRSGIVDDERARIVCEWAGEWQLALREQRAEIFSVFRAMLGNRRSVFGVLNDRGILHVAVGGRKQLRRDKE